MVIQTKHAVTRLLICWIHHFSMISVESVDSTQSAHFLSHNPKEQVLVTFGCWDLKAACWFVVIFPFVFDKTWDVSKTCMSKQVLWFAQNPHVKQTLCHWSRSDVATPRCWKTLHFSGWFSWSSHENPISRGFLAARALRIPDPSDWWPKQCHYVSGYRWLELLLGESNQCFVATVSIFLPRL